MTFPHHQGGRGRHVKSDYARTIIEQHPLVHTPGTCALISSCAPSTVYPNRIM